MTNSIPTNFDTQIAFRCNEQPSQVCLVSELKKGDIFYLVTDGAKSDLMRAINDSQIKKINGVEQWHIEGVLYE